MFILALLAYCCSIIMFGVTIPTLLIHLYIQVHICEQDSAHLVGNEEHKEEDKINGFEQVGLSSEGNQQECSNHKQHPIIGQQR